MPALQFDPETHIYRVDDVILPSITQVLKAEGFINIRNVKPEDLQRGGYVHLMTHYYDTVGLDEDSIDPELRGYLDGYKKFKEDTGFRVNLSEEPMYHAHHRFAGTPDKNGEMRGKPSIIEEKTGAIMPYTAIQTAAQELLWNANGGPELGTVNRYGLRLFPNGKYKLESFKDRVDRAIFLNALTLYTWKRNHKIVNLKGGRK